MLLRRVTEHVKTQNWFAVGIDFLIVVVGVFIGIQVSNWNADIEESREAERMRDSILVDLENERIVSTVLREYWVTTRAYANVAVDGFQGGAAVDDKQFVISAYQASQAQFPLSNRATYEQMVASGNINIAGSEELRLAIINYYVSNWAQGPDNVTVPPYRANIRRAIPHPIQAAIRENCGDRITAFNSISALVLPKSCDLELPVEAFADAAAYLRERPDLLMDLRLQLSDLEAKLQNLDQVDIQLEHMLSLAGH